MDKKDESKASNNAAISPMANTRADYKQPDLDEATLKEEQLSESEQRARAKRYADKGKAKVEDGNNDPNVSIVEVESSDSEQDDMDKKALEEADFRYAAKLQNEEYQKNLPIFQGQGHRYHIHGWVSQQAAGVVGLDDSSSEGTLNNVPIEPDYMDTDLIADDNEAAPIMAYHPAFQMEPAAWRRCLPASSICLTKTLTQSAVIPLLARLVLSIAEVAVLGDCPEIVNQYPEPLLEENLVVYDTNDIRYDMGLISFYPGDGREPLQIEYCIEKDWAHFISLNDVAVGDVIDIYRTEDPRVTFGPYFVIKIRTRPVLSRGKSLKLDDYVNYQNSLKKLGNSLLASIGSPSNKFGSSGRQDEQQKAYDTDKKEEKSKRNKKKSFDGHPYGFRKDTPEDDGKNNGKKSGGRGHMVNKFLKK